MKKPVIGVIGANDPDPEQVHLAYEVGGLIAARGAMMVCGGLGGIMEAASKGAHEKDGTVIGIIPGLEKHDANQFVDIVIPTGMGVMRNVLVMHTADVVIAFPGAFGTLMEISVALASKKVVIYFPGSWDLRKIGQIDAAFFKEAFDPMQAIGLALAALSQQNVT